MDQLIFKKYCSFNNHYDQKSLNKIRDALIFHKEEKGIWDATEKVHGSHFALTVRQFNDSLIIKAAKRTGFISEQESFFEYESVLVKYYHMAEKAFLLVKAKYPDVTQITIHGEIIGG